MGSLGSVCASTEEAMPPYHLTVSGDSRSYCIANLHGTGRPPTRHRHFGEAGGGWEVSKTIPSQHVSPVHIQLPYLQHQTRPALNTTGSTKRGEGGHRTHSNSWFLRSVFAPGRDFFTEMFLGYAFQRRTGESPYVYRYMTLPPSSRIADEEGSVYMSRPSMLYFLYYT